ncbi:MAG: hypothetical protein WC749_04205 [Dehalococcoidia bacterium]
MESALIALFCIALIVFGVFTISDASLSATDAIATAWRQREDTSVEIAGTHISSVGAQTQSAGSIVEMTLQNAGKTELMDFENWDVILQYYSSGSSAGIFSDSFETPTGLGNWVQDAYNDWNTDNERVWNGSLSAHFDNAASESILTLEDAIDFSAGSNRTPETLSFYWWIDTQFDSGEYLAVDVWNGASWIEKGRIRGDVVPSEEGQWLHPVIDITSYQTSDFKVRFRGQCNRNDEDGFVDSVSITGIPNSYNIERLTYMPGTLEDNQWNVEGIYLDAGASDPELFDPGIFDPDEEMVIQMKVDPAVQAGSTNLVTVSTPNGVSASAIFTGSP